MKCGVCGQYSVISICQACRYAAISYLLGSADVLNALDAYMTRPGLDIDQTAAASNSAHRANLASWAMVCAEQTTRTPEIDRQLSSAMGQAALIAQFLSDATPEWAADCVIEITRTYSEVIACLSHAKSV